MTRRGLWLVLSLGVSLVLLNACQKTPQQVAPAPSPTPATVDTAAIETELLRIENDWPRIIKEKDAETVKRIEADDAIFVYPDGSVGDKNVDVNDIGTGVLSAESWEMLDLKVNVLSKDTAVVSGRHLVKGGRYKMPNGSSNDISGNYRFVETFVRRNGAWQVVAGLTTKIEGQAATALPNLSPTTSPTAKASPATGAAPEAGASPATSASPRRPLPPIRVPPPSKAPAPPKSTP
jgi:hypothetical protein